MQTAKSKGIHISMNDGQLELKFSKGNHIEPGLLQEIKDNKQLLIDFLNDSKWKFKKVEAFENELTPFDRSLIEHIPLSYSQERLWFIEKLEGTVQYHLPAVLKLKGKLNIEALQDALKTIVDRHEVLRTVILENNGQGFQYVLQQNDWQLSIDDNFDQENDAQDLQQYIAALIRRPFDLSNDYMLRANLVKLGEDDYVLVVTMHHIASDGWSLSVIVKEVIELYGSFVENRSAQLPALALQYADYAIWQRTYLQGELLDKKIRYWKNKLEGVLPLQLPTDYERPVIQSMKGSVTGLLIDKELSAQLRSLCQQQETTMFMTLLAAFKILLYRYSGQYDICVGTPIANRNYQEVENLIGFFVNTLALRSELDGNLSFPGVLKKIKATTLEAYEHQEVPFEKVVDVVMKQRDMSRHPLFQVMFIFQNTPDVPQLQLGDVQLSQYSFEHNSSKFDLTFSINESNSGIQVSIEYCTDLYRETTINRMKAHFQQMLHSIVAAPSQAIDELSMLTRDEEAQLLAGFNKMPAPSSDSNILALFEAQVKANPKTIAAVFEQEQFTYKELSERSNQLAHYLQSRGVNKETLVPVCIERSLDMLVAILASLKTGGAFVPVDPGFPSDRINYMLEDCGAGLIITNKQSRSKFQSKENIEVIELDAEWEEISTHSRENLNTKISQTQLAYTIYTSGSTGKPKGVMVEHGNLVNLLVNISKEISFNKNATFFSVTTFSFDICYLELFVPLINGGRLIIVSRDTATDGFKLKEGLAIYRPTHMQATPSTWQLLQNAEWQNEEGIKILVGGEALKEDLKDYLTKRGEAWNVYGPTETTIWSTIKKLSTAEKVLIGSPIANNTIYILNPHKNLSPVGVAGEITIGGLQVARGYLDRPDLTAEKFIADPFSKAPGARMYKTGDLGRWQENGEIEYLGRMDEQVKIRGYRIELGEIETVLQQNETVQAAVVLAKDDNEGNKRLVGYIVANKTFDKEAIVAHLKTKLPEYMIPAIWVEMENLPLTPNGKIDRKALPDPDITTLLSNEYIAPRNETEQALAGIWQELLSVERAGVHDNFFDLGGHSLKALQVISFIRKELQVELSIRDLFIRPTIAELSSHLRKKNPGLSVPSIEALEQRPELIPLSFSQERLWFIHQLEGSVQYNVPAVLKLKGNLNIAALEFAFKEIINRHEVLRTVIKDYNGRGYQHIREEDNWQLEKVNGSVYKSDQPALQKYIQQSISNPFDLSKDYMLRASLISFDEQEHWLVFTIHHIASDAWSIPIIVEEIVELYAANVEDRPVQLLALELQYADYAIWQRNYLQPGLLEQKLQYWKHTLDGAAPLQLPTDYKRPPVRGSRGASTSGIVDKEILKQLHVLSRKEGSTLFMTLLAAFKVLLYRYSGQQDISVGTSVANRNKQELEKMIGFFVNTIAFRSEVKGDVIFTDLLQAVKTTTLEAYDHQEVPFEKVVETVVKDRDPGRSPLFQVMLVLRNTPHSSELKLGDIVFSGEGFEQTSVKFDITFFVNETSNGLYLTVEYSTDLYKEETIIRMMEHFKNLLSSVAKTPHQKIGLLPMLAATELQELVEGFNQSSVIYPKDKTIVSLFEEQVEKAPGNISVVFEQDQLTYKELNERSNQLAHYLLSKGVKKGTLIPVFIDRSTEMLVAIMGILKAGAAYVPIDVDFPSDRISYMLEDTRASIVVSSKKTAAKIHELTNSLIDIIELDQDNQELASQSTNNIQSSPAPNDLAYVIYTSGSTGKPKGVMIEHRSLVDYVVGLNEKTHIDQCRSFALVSTIATDLGNTVIFSSLLFGGALHLFSKETVSNSAALHQYFRANKIDCLKIVPSHWKALSEAERLLLPVRLLVFGGEALPAEMVEGIRLSGSSCVIVNHYGPTETTIGKLLHVVKEENSYSGTIPIGKPFSNTSVYVLSKELQPCPVGVPGQLYIAGDGIARGYLNNALLTKEKFISNPFSNTPSVMYGTGDLVKHLGGGDILFIGRVDDQVKIRGYRVELGEIESILQQSPLVSQAVVLAKEDKQGNKRLVAYIVAEEDFDREEIQSYLKDKLPEYMVPSILMEVSSLPLTANGKVDRKALPDPDASVLLSDQYTAPRNEAEEKLAAIWQEILEVDQVGIHDDFFVLGGHSLLAIRLISAIRKELAVELPISDIFDYPTIAALVAQLEGQSSNILPPITSLHPRPQHIPLSFSQERLWFIHQLDGSVQYHVPSVLRLKGELNNAALSVALQSIVDRHEVLRTVIRVENGQPFQSIMQPGKWQLNSIDGSAYDQNQLRDLVKDLLNKPFDLSSDHMLRAALIKVADKEHVLAVTMHHIASDGWSTSILVKEVVELYKSYLEKKPAKLNPLKIQYADYAIWQRTYLQGEVLDKKLGYWKQKLEGVTPLQLPTDYTRPAIQSSRGAVSTFRFGKELYTQLQLLSQQQGATLFMTLLSAFKILLHHYSGQKDICVGTAIAGRQQQEVEELIGFFINTLALRTIVNGGDTFNEMLAQVKATTLEAYDNQEVPFEKVVDTVVKERDMSRSPLFQVVFALQNTPAVPDLLLGDVVLSREPFSQDTTKFDISVVMIETSDGLQGSFQYCTDLFSEESVNRMISHFTNLVKSIATDPQQKIGAMPMLTIAEEQQLLTGFNKMPIEFQGEQTILDLFEEAVAKRPQAIAVVFEQQQLSYKELDERSNQLAHYLRNKGVNNETLVPICMHRCPEMIIGMLGILKAGGAYVPIDPAYPGERVKYMMDDTAASCAISRADIKLPAMGGIEIIRIDVDWPAISQQPLTKPEDKPTPCQLVYVIYTSGSTGQPKGVMIEHRNLMNLVSWHNHEYKVSGTSRATAMAGVGFDAFGWEVWPYLSAGASLYIIDDSKRLSVSALLAYFISNRITHSFIATAVVQEFANASRNQSLPLRYLLTGGDKLSISSLEGIGYAFVNNYGPTENTVVASNYFLSQKDELKIPPIGKPISNTTIYILNESNKLVPTGVSGEICIGGAGLARGYWNRAELTAEKFIDDPFSNAEGSRLYKTGDLGRWLPDSNIEYLGRIDEQVKIRGYRIELGEIETVLQQSGLVKQAVVLSREDKIGNKSLVGYIIAKEGFDHQNILSYLKDRLPAYMVPGLWVEMEKFPLTANGKIDKKSLPAPGEERSLNNQYVAPRNELETKLALIWQELLGIEKVGVEDNFFESGGNSLLAMKMVSYIERDLLVAVPIQLLFQFSRISDLSRYLEIQDKGDFREKTSTSFEVLDV